MTDNADFLAAAYSALTASSTLQHLSLHGSCMPADAWQHVFPAGRQLPHLQYLNIAGYVAPGTYAQQAAPEGSRIVRCCPGLQHLDIRHLPHSTGLLTALQGLSRLHTLHLNASSRSVDEASLTVLRQLTGMRELHVRVAHTSKKRLHYHSQLALHPWHDATAPRLLGVL
jgi:hypothetical protein